MPQVFISHGAGDNVLPIARTSRRIVPRLREEGYQVHYAEFDGGHTVPAAIAEEALNRLVSEPPNTGVVRHRRSGCGQESWSSDRDDPGPDPSCIKQPA
jgi:hypothetical protein